MFDRNVRLFLGARQGGVNAGIRQTIDSTTERRNFWAYNNGMTLVCDHFIFNEENGTLKILNFSIVNGCQTTVSIANAPDDSLEHVSVLARVIASTQEATINSIITNTNRQNPIQPWDINSQDKRQKQLKRELAKEPHAYLYVLRRGETSQLSSDDKRKFTRNGRLQIIPHDVLAQYLAAFRGLPVIAYKDKSRLFTTHREFVFADASQTEEILLTWLAGEAAEAAVRDAIKEAIDREDQDQVRILKQGAKLFVLSVIGIILRERNGKNYLNKLKREVAGSNATRERLDAYATLAVIWYVQAMKDLISSGTPLNQLVRSQEAAFPRIRDKILTNWKVQSLSKAWVDEVLPKL